METRVLIVGDERFIRAVKSLVLDRKSSHRERFAECGFHALVELRHQLPAVCFTDLNTASKNGLDPLFEVPGRIPPVERIFKSGAFSGSFASAAEHDAFDQKCSGVAFILRVEERPPFSDSNPPNSTGALSPVLVRRKRQDSA
jgi:DNA-binding NtrC family response regulator